MARSVDEMGIVVEVVVSQLSEKNLSKNVWTVANCNITSSMIMSLTNGWLGQSKKKNTLPIYAD